MRPSLGALLLVAACQKPAPVIVVVDAAPIVETTSAVPDASFVDAATARGLPSKERLIAALKGTGVHGFIGMTNSAERVYSPIGADTSADKPVLVASFTKLWTAIAILRAVKRGELSLDDELRTLLPDVKAKAWSDSTVRDLMSHTSRVPEFDDTSGYYSKPDVDFTNPVPVLAKYIGAGTEKRGVWKYRNSEFALLGAIIQAKAGAPAADVLTREVLTPAGMTHAGLVVGAAPQDVDFTPMGHVRPQNFFTAGAGYASANDLLLFFDALGAGKLLDADSQKLLFSGSPEHNHAALGCWAFPFATPEAGTTLLVERPGSFGNVRLFTAFFPEERRAIVMWSGAGTDVGRPRTKGSLAASLANLALE